MKTLVLEGGAMRGLFSVGVMDVLMENGIEFDNIVGVSAGTAFGVNYKSGQKERGLRYNKLEAREWRNASYLNWLLEGNIYSKEFCFHYVPRVVDPFDCEAFSANPTKFYGTVTNAKTGKAEYLLMETGDDYDLEVLRASCAMPIAARPVELGGNLYFDGGVADSIPVGFAKSLGSNKTVVILTKPKEEERLPQKKLPLIKLLLRKYPEIYSDIASLHLQTRTSLELVESDPTVFGIYPPAPIPCGFMEHNPDNMDLAHKMGRETMEALLPSLLEFLA